MSDQRLSPGEAARRARAQRERDAHDRRADDLNKTTYAEKSSGPEIINPKDTSSMSVSQRLAARRKKKQDYTAGDAAAALTKSR